MSELWGKGELAVTGMGMVSSLGDDIVTSCAAARAGLVRVQPLDFEAWDIDFENMEPAVGHVVPAVARGFSGVGRLVMLAAMALRDASGRMVAGAGGRTGIVVNLPGPFLQEQANRSPEGKPGPRTDPREVQEREQFFLARLARVSPVAWDPGYQRAICGDQAGFVGAIAEAARWLETQEVARCLVGGVDCMVDQAGLSALSAVGLLKKADNPTGIMPGEGAAFLVLEGSAQARRRRATVARLAAPAIGREPQDRFSEGPPLGRALAQTLSTTCDAMAGVAPEFVMAPLNGDSWRAQDWGASQVMLRAKGHIFPEIRIPALSFGELGAATGPVSVCLAIRGFARGYLSPPGLVWLASEDGARASFTVSAVAS